MECCEDEDLVVAGPSGLRRLSRRYRLTLMQSLGILTQRESSFGEREDGELTNLTDLELLRHRVKLVAVYER